MSNIVIFGGTGYAGSAVLLEAINRGHEVTSVSRNSTNSPVEGVRYIVGSALDPTVRSEALANAGVVILALSPRGDMAGKLQPLYAEIAKEAAQIGARLIVIGGFGSLRQAEGAPRFADSSDLPPEFKSEAQELVSVLDSLNADNAPGGLDWLFISPAREFGSHNHEDKRGTYKIDGPIAVFNEDGRSQLSNFDLALAIIDEVEKPTHHKQHISVASY